MRIFALVLALIGLAFTPSEADAQRRGRGRTVRRAPVRRIIGRAPVRRIVGRQPIVVSHRQAIVVAHHNVVRQIVAVPTYQAYVAPSQIVVQRLVTAPYTAPVVVEKEVVETPAPIVQRVVIQREVTGYAGGCGATAAFRSY